MFLQILLISFAAICKAFADTLDHHFDTSIFMGWSRKWFDPNVTIKTAPQIFGYPLDGWHIANSLQICSWAALPFVYEPVFGSWLLNYAAIGILFIVIFNLFYNKLFR